MEERFVFNCEACEIMWSCEVWNEDTECCPDCEQPGVHRPGYSTPAPAESHRGGA